VPLDDYFVNPAHNRKIPNPANKTAMGTGRGGNLGIINGSVATAKNRIAIRMTGTPLSIPNTPHTSVFTGTSHYPVFLHTYIKIPQGG
jgi:hypothetical protein